jgi:hypothetical protein
MTTTQPKEELNNLMVEMFGMLEDMEIQEGKYLQFAEMFKQMNININRLAQIKTAVQTNTYYVQHVRPATRRTTLRRKRLTEAQKAIHKNYVLCNCGRYIHEDMQQEHLQTAVHYQGRRNRKYALTKPSEEQMELEIQREVLLQSFIIKHLVKTTNINIDNLATDEQGV